MDINEVNCWEFSVSMVQKNLIKALKHAKLYQWRLKTNVLTGKSQSITIKSLISTVVQLKIGLSILLWERCFEREKQLHNSQLFLLTEVQTHSSYKSQQERDIGFQCVWIPTPSKPCLVKWTTHSLRRHTSYINYNAYNVRLAHS